MQRDYLQSLIDAGHTQRGIASLSSVTQSTVRYWLKKYSLNTIRPKEFWDIELFRHLCSSSDSLHQVLVGMGKNPSNASYKIARKFSIECDINLPVFNKVGVKRVQQTIDEVFTYGKKRSNESLKRLMVSNLGVANECVCCGSGPEWQGKPLTLQLDHVDGDTLNNRIENLRIVCPNCHSQTDTFCRGKKK